jgi:hypothetical protein
MNQLVRLTDAECSELAKLAVAVGGLMPSWQNPERFHEQKSEIAAALRRIARNGYHLRTSSASAPVPPPQPVQVITVIRVVVLRPHLIRPRPHRYPRPPRDDSRQMSLFNSE